MPNILWTPILHAAPIKEEVPAWKRVWANTLDDADFMKIIANQTGWRVIFDEKSLHHIEPVPGIIFLIDFPLTQSICDLLVSQGFVV